VGSWIAPDVGFDNLVRIWRGETTRLCIEIFVFGAVLLVVEEREWKIEVCTEDGEERMRRVR